MAEFRVGVWSVVFIVAKCLLTVFVLVSALEGTVVVTKAAPYAAFDVASHAGKVLAVE